jgi:hypothetical protein
LRENELADLIDTSIPAEKKKKKKKLRKARKDKLENFELQRMLNATVKVTPVIHVTGNLSG